MTTSQLSIALNDLGISSPMNTWLKLSPVSIVKLAQDANLYLDNDSELYYFDSKNELLYCTYGDFRKYASTETDVNKFKHYRTYPFDMISGFICTVFCGPYGSYYTKRFNR